MVGHLGLLPQTAKSFKQVGRDPAERDRPGERFLHAIGLALEQRRIGRARTDAIDAYPLCGVIDCKRLGQTYRRGLSRTVRKTIGNPNHAAD